MTKTKKIIIAIIVLIIIIILFLGYQAYQKRKKDELNSASGVGGATPTKFSFNSVGEYTSNISALNYQLSIQQRRVDTLTGDLKTEAQKIVDQLSAQIAAMEAEKQAFINSQTLSSTLKTVAPLPSIQCITTPCG